MRRRGAIAGLFISSTCSRLGRRFLPAPVFDPAPVFEERRMLRVGAKERTVITGTLVLAELRVIKLLLAAVRFKCAGQLQLVVACQLFEAQVSDLQVSGFAGWTP